MTLAMFALMIAFIALGVSLLVYWHVVRVERKHRAFIEEQDRLLMSRDQIAAAVKVAGAFGHSLATICGENTIYLEPEVLHALIEYAGVECPHSTQLHASALREEEKN